MSRHKQLHAIQLNEQEEYLQLTHCTLTGVDGRTDLTELAALSAEFPLVEWGLLYSPKRQGLPGRYPSVVALQRALLELPAEVRVALHVCGNGVPDLLDGTDAVVSELVDIVEGRRGRVQLNYKHSDGFVSLDTLARFVERRPALSVITQRNAANVGVWEALTGVTNHFTLFDASGGRGISPGEWPKPLHAARCGYAGGLGPGNLRSELGRIDAIAGNASVWVDMEGSLREQDKDGDDWFSTARARACLQQLSSWLADRRA